MAHGMATTGETQLLPGFGLLGLIDDLAEIIGQQFVSQTRFDPQRRADTEQTLYEQIPTLLQALATQSEVSCSVEGHTARISADALRTVGQRLSAALAPLIPADTSCIALDSLLSSLPGLSLSSKQDQPLRTQAISPDAILPSATHLSRDNDELVFRRQVACTGASQSDTAAPQTRAADKPLVSHYLIAGHAATLIPGRIIAPGVSVTGATQIAITSDIEVRLNGETVDGDLTIKVGDHLVTGGVEVHFITVES
jgi:hypothetical protein